VDYKIEGEGLIEQPHILVVDDDKRIRELLRSYLMENGYAVSLAASPAEARERMRGIAFDLLILDVMMPGETGLSLISELRSKGFDVPVLMLSAMAEPHDRISGLQSGSDDYLSKPFEPQELLLRLKSLLRRAAPIIEAAKDVSFGDCRFNLLTGELQREGEIVRLTSREKDILRNLVQKTGQALSRLQLAQNGGEDSARSVDVQINRLRQKIESDPANPRFLQTVRGAGYALFVDRS
jgi:two-component system, OmpR family, phosphate regulon response regulator OmpR